MQKLKSVTEIENLEGVYVFLRASLNVPVKNGVVRDEFRITQAMKTVECLRTKGARIILCSHLGKDGQESIVPVYEVLKNKLPVTLSPEVVGPVTQQLRDDLKNGEVLLLENVRKEQGEMENSADFAHSLASLADVFVNDDFAASHRAHASLHAITAYMPSYIGISFEHEYRELGKALEAKHPALFILGGAKFETKVPLVEKFLTLYDTIFIGGALANDFFKAKGYEVGKSVVSEMTLAGSPLLSHPKVLLPVDVTVEKDGERRVCKPSEVGPEENILDAGPETIELLKSHIEKAATILWNGPLGYYEAGYTQCTQDLARAIGDAYAFSVVGGGDTVASIESLGISSKFSFLSTAGGAMLTFLEEGTLTAIEAQKASNTHT